MVESKCVYSKINRFYWKKGAHFPLEKELTKVKSIPCHMIHGGIYFKTKIGVFSGLNGDKITKDFITNLIS